MTEVITCVLKVAKAGKATKTALTAFDALNSLLKGSDLDSALIKPHVAELVDSYCSLISRHADTKKMAEIALRSMGYFIYNTVVIAHMNEAQSGRVLDTILDVIKNSDSKSACNLAVWCIAIQQLRLAIGRKLPDVLAALSQLIGTNQSRFGSSTIEYESISAYGKLFTQIPESMTKLSDAWVPPVCVRLFHENPTVRDKAETVIKAALPTLRRNGISPSLSDALVRELNGGLLERFNLFLDEESPIQGKDKPALAMRVWGYFVVLLEKELWSSGLIKAFLQIPSATFNHADPVVRAVTWEGWQCLMDNCTHDMAHLLRPKSKRTELLLKPYLSSVEREQNPDVRRALLRSWLHMITGFGQSLPAVFTKVFFPFLEAVAKVPEHDLVEEVLHSIAKLLALPSARTEEAEKSPTDPEPLALEADWLVDNLALFILQILPPFIFRGSEALLEVWRGLIERVAGLYTQDPKSKRIASVLSQVVHFISDLLSSGSSLSGNKEGSVPLTYSASLLAVFLRSFSAPNRNARGSHSGHHHRLSPSPHHAMSESSSPTSHASITTLLGVLLSGLFSNVEAVSDTKTFTDVLNTLLSIVPAPKEKQVNSNASLLTALHVLQSLLESSSARKTNQKVLMMGWMCIARNLEERMEETNCAADVPFPFALPNKHDHRTVYYTALLFPLRAALQGDGQTSWTMLVDGTVGDIKKTWNLLYSTFFRISALRDEAEGCVEHMCQLIMDILRPGLRWNNGVGKIIESTKAIVEVAGANHPMITVTSAHPNRHKSKPGEPSALLKLLLRLLKAMSVFPETLAQDEGYGHEYVKGLDAASKQLMMNEWQLSLTFLIDTITALFNKAKGRAEVMCLVSTFAEGMAKWLQDSPVPPDASITLSRSATASVRKDLDKLFDVIAKSVTSNHKPPYEAESAKLLTPILKEALVTKRKLLKNSAIQFWNSTFGTAPSLPDLPEDLIAVLGKLQGKVPIKLPLGWNGGADVMPSMSTDVASMALADDDSLHVPTQVFPGSDDRPKFHKPVVPAQTEANASSTDGTPRRIAKRRRSAAPSAAIPTDSSEEKENDRRYVDAVNSGMAQKKRKSEKEELLTEHQLEVLERQRKEAKTVAFYNGLDQSSQDGSTFSLFAAGSLFMPDEDGQAALLSKDPKAQAKAKAEEAARQREREKEKERQRLEKERKELEEKERQERENNGTEKLRLRKRASINWRKEQILMQEKELDKDEVAPDDSAERSPKRQRVEAAADKKNHAVVQADLNSDHQSGQQTNGKETKTTETLPSVYLAPPLDLRRMLEELSRHANGDIDAQIKGAGDVLAGFTMQELFTVQDRLTGLLSVMTQHLRKRNH